MFILFLNCVFEWCPSHLVSFCGSAFYTSKICDLTKSKQTKKCGENWNRKRKPFSVLFYAPWELKEDLFIWLVEIDTQNGENACNSTLLSWWCPVSSLCVWWWCIKFQHWAYLYHKGHEGYVCSLRWMNMSLGASSKTQPLATGGLSATGSRSPLGAAGSRSPLPPRRHIPHTRIEQGKIFTPGNFPCWGHVFGSENFRKSDPENGFPPEILFQNSSIFSNISYRGVSWSDCLPRGVYI